MNPKNEKLAIVIPAYKETYLDKALESLVNQTNQNFSVYIGDDSSPYDLYSVVKKYQYKLNLFYKKFDQNLGGQDLVAQWERCVALTKNEEWIWLFSDDDELGKKCVENFYNHIEQKSDNKLLHFNVNVINEKGNVVEEVVFPKKLDAFSFTLLKLKGVLKSFVVEYVFRRDLYNEVGGFKKYDLAWNADDATWIEMAKKNCITTIVGDCVNWRKSSENISPNNKDVAIVKRKINADLEHIEYLNKSFDGLVRNFKLTIAVITWFSVSLLKYEKIFSSREIYEYLKQSVVAVRKPWLYPLAVVYFRVKAMLIGGKL